MKRICNSKPSPLPEASENPYKMLCYAVENDDFGNQKLIECEPVAVSLASAYSVSENYLTGRQSSLRHNFPNTDLVDMSEKLNELI